MLINYNIGNSSTCVVRILLWVTCQRVLYEDDDIDNLLFPIWFTQQFSSFWFFLFVLSLILLLNLSSTSNFGIKNVENFLLHMIIYG